MERTASRFLSSPGCVTRRLPALPQLGGRDLYNDAETMPRGVLFALACLIGISIWNAGEIMIIILRSFRGRFKTLYYWSIITAALGVIISSTSQIYNLGAASRSPVVAQAIGSAGWVPMVTGQSLVLYSRLHLLRVDTRLLRLLLGLIVFNAVSIHVPTIVVGVLASLPRSGRYAGPYDTVEKIEITMFFVQEVSLSGVYLWQARHFQRKYGRRLHGGGGGGGCVGEGVGGMLRDLVAVNAVVVALDVSVLALQFMNLFFVQIVAKNFIYSLKLKLELGVLNQLREFVRRTRDLDPHYVERERRWELGKVQIQWEAALRRAFGSIGRTRSTRDGEPETHVAEGQQVMTPALLKSTTREVLISGGQPGPGEVQAPEKNLGIANNTEQP